MVRTQEGDSRNKQFSQISCCFTISGAGSVGNPLQQHYATPLFRIAGATGKLVCAHCQRSTLIDGYDPDNFVGISIRCSSCYKVTTTPELQVGEILPKEIMMCKSSDSFQFRRTHDVPNSAAMTSQTQLLREQGLVHPRPSAPRFDMSEKTVRWLVSEYNRLSRGAYQKQFEALKRHVSQKDWDAALQKYPFQWSCGRLGRMRRLGVGVAPISDVADAAAVTNLEVFHNFVQTWDHHPRLDALSNDFATGEGFHHAMTIFACLRAFFLRGVKVGIAPPLGGGFRTADLYIRHGVEQKFHLEVKTPVSLRYPECLKLNEDIVCDTAIKALRSAKGQLGTTKPGLLVIGLTFIMDNKFQEVLTGLEKAVATAGANYSGVAGILVLAPRFKEALLSGRPLRQFGHECIFKPNNHFSMENVFLPIFPLEIS